MKIRERVKSIILTVIFFLLVPWGLVFIAFFVAFFIEEALAGEPYLSNVLLYIANWPSFLLKIYPTITTLDGIVMPSVERGLFNLLVIKVNAIGWAIIGFVVGLIRSAMKKRSQDSILKNK